MFDFAGSEILLIGIVALVAIGPKDLPVAIKAVSQMVKKARKMAGEFQTHVDEMVREADLGDVRNSFNDIRKMDIKSQLLKAVDTDGTIRKSLEPVDFSPSPPPVPVHDLITNPNPPAISPEFSAPSDIGSDVVVVPHADATAAFSTDPAPAFVPPRYTPFPTMPIARVAPAFIPPAFVPPPAFNPSAAATAAVSPIESA